MTNRNAKEKKGERGRTRQGEREVERNLRQLTTNRSAEERKLGCKKGRVGRGMGRGINANPQQIKVQRKGREKEEVRGEGRREREKDRNLRQPTTNRSAEERRGEEGRKRRRS